METIPIKLIAVCSIMALVVGTGTYQAGAFLDMRAEQGFVEDLLEFSRIAGVLRSAGDHGAVGSASISVPPGYQAALDLDSDTLTGMLRDRNYSLGLPANLTMANLGGGVCRNGTVLLPGGSSYELRLYYGHLEEGQVKNLTVVLV